MADAILEALDDPLDRERLQANARKTYEEHFTPRVAGARLCAELEQIGLGRNSAAPLEGVQRLALASRSFKQTS
jgi:hypothetical protein